jgi:hypothetical protein
MNLSCQRSGLAGYAGERQVSSRVWAAVDVLGLTRDE